MVNSNSKLFIWWFIIFVITMEMSQIMKLGQDLGLEGVELLNFIERKEKEV